VCLVIIGFGGAALSLFTFEQDGNVSLPNFVTATPVVIRPTAVPTQSASGKLDAHPDQSEQTEPNPLPTDDEDILIPTQMDSAQSGTLETLENTIVPINDLLDLAQRLEGKEDIPLTIDAPAKPYQVGDTENFWVTNVDTNENSTIEAVLRYATEHAYFWIENGVPFDKDELSTLAETFERDIYVINREFFGSEWSPGVDNDPHLYIIFASDLGYSLAGYFSSIDEYHPLAHEFSNAHETFMLNADNVDLDDEFTYGVLAHEFQHMIHWYQDRNESTWMNEGFAELSMLLNSYSTGGSDYIFSSNPDLQLNDWPTDMSDTTPHYGAAFLFVTYFLNRFGESATQALVGHPANGMTSVDAVLTELEIRDQQTGQIIRADDVFIDWAITNYLQDDTVGDGRYSYHIYDSTPRFDETETIYSCNPNMTTRDVHQYGADYIRIVCDGEYTLNFEGSIQTGVLPVDAFSGSYAFWSNRGDESNMTLTRTFDFTDQSSPLTLTFWTWYDLEDDYDYLYVEASIDGKNWDILDTPSGTDFDPSGNSYGWGYNGLSGGDGSWIQETVDLTQYAGQEVRIRFEYVTDAAVNGEGFLLDDIAVPEIGYFNDFESDSAEWDAAGFVRIQNVLPQTYQLALISTGNETKVEYIELTEENTAEIPISVGGDVDEVIMVVTGTTRYTRQTAPYRFDIVP
jgi:immune inhibitor A